MVKDVTLIFVVMMLSTIFKLPNTRAFDNVVKKHVYNNDGLGSYSFEYIVSDGSYRKEDGGVVTNAAGVRSLVVRGEYGFIDPDGEPHSVRYVADTNGYRPQTIDTDTIFNDRRIV